MRHITPLTCPAWSSAGCVCPEQDAFINERRSGVDRRAQRAEVAQPEESAASQLLRKVRREWYSFTPYCTLKAEIDALLDGPHDAKVKP